MLLVLYSVSGQLERAVGEPLKFWDDPKRTDDDYSPDGELMVCSPPGRYHFQAKVLMSGGLIKEVTIL